VVNEYRQSNHQQRWLNIFTYFSLQFPVFICSAQLVLRRWSATSICRVFTFHLLHSRFSNFSYLKLNHFFLKIIIPNKTCMRNIGTGVRQRPSKIFCWVMKSLISKISQIQLSVVIQFLADLSFYLTTAELPNRNKICMSPKKGVYDYVTKEFYLFWLNIMT